MSGPDAVGTTTAGARVLADVQGQEGHLVEVAAKNGAKDGHRLHDHNEVPVNEGCILETMPPWKIEDEVGNGASQDCDVGQPHRGARREVFITSVCRQFGACKDLSKPRG